MRSPDELDENDVLDDLPVNKIYPVLDSINCLAATAWKINKPVSERDVTSHMTSQLQTSITCLYQSPDESINWWLQVLDAILEVFRSGGDEKLDIPLSEDKMCAKALRASDR